jgi:hypothetical protein
VFDLSKGVGKRRGVYEEGEWQQERRLSHLALRAVSPELLEGSDGGQGRTTPTSRNFGKSLPFKACFLVLAPHFAVNLSPVSFARFPQTHTSHLPAQVHVPAFDAWFAFDLLDES